MNEFYQWDCFVKKFFQKYLLLILRIIPEIGITYIEHKVNDLKYFTSLC